MTPLIKTGLNCVAGAILFFVLLSWVFYSVSHTTIFACFSLAFILAGLITLAMVIALNRYCRKNY